MQLFHLANKAPCDFLAIVFVFFFLLEQMDDGVAQYVTHAAYLPGT